MSDNDSEFGTFLAGFVIGGLVGTAVALVLAPQSGAATRSQITGKGQDLASAGEQYCQSVMESADAFTEQEGERASHFDEDA